MLGVSNFNMADVLANQLRKSAAAPATADTVRDIEAVTAEIIQLKKDAGNAIIGIGERLTEAKKMLPHGEWIPWLTKRVEFSEKTAQNFMRLAREWGANPQALADLGATKALTLLVLPSEEREAFMAENNVVDMTSRELQKAIRERDDALLAAEAAKQEAHCAEESRLKMESDMELLKRLHCAAQEGEKKAQAALAQARTELKEFLDRPVEVAVQPVVDEEALAEEREKARKADAARREAEEKRKAAETELEDLRKQLQAADEAKSQDDLDLEQIYGIFAKMQHDCKVIHDILMRLRSHENVKFDACVHSVFELLEELRDCIDFV